MPEENSNKQLAKIIYQRLVESDLIYTLEEDFLEKLSTEEIQDDDWVGITKKQSIDEEQNSAD